MEIARVTITLMDVHPPVRRVIEVPLGVTLADLHLIIQAAMGWENSHLYHFHDGHKIYGTAVPGWSDPDYRMTPAAKTRLRHMAHNLLRAAHDRHSLKVRRKSAGWDTGYLNDILRGTA